MYCSLGVVFFVSFCNDEVAARREVSDCAFGYEYLLFLLRSTFPTPPTLPRLLDLQIPLRHCYGQFLVVRSPFALVIQVLIEEVAE